jgi:DHA3 family macrolide efflux protein-like MFS transporter
LHAIARARLSRQSEPDGRSGTPVEAGRSGMLGFTIVWVGQMLSLLGTSMTGFALTIWAWQKTGQATALALVGFANFAPVVLFSPVAGAIVDRYDRKRIMMLADLAAGLPTVALLLLYSTGNLQIWMLYITGAIAGTFQSFHFPAYSAAVTMMVNKKHYSRAESMLAMAEFASGFFAPIAAAVLLTIIGIGSIMMIDITTFTVAILMLLLVHVPKPPVTEEGRRSMGSLWKESLYGFWYIIKYPSLLGLQLTFLGNNFLASIYFTLLAPMVLSRTGNNPIMYGSVMSAGAIGGLIGSIVLTAWGGPKRRIHGVLVGWTLSHLIGAVLMGMGGDVTVWIPVFFASMFVSPMINASNQTIWQSKVAPDLQGRVFATRRLIAQVSAPPAMLVAGFLADAIFEPAMRTGGSLAPAFGWLVGIGPGAGMALIFIFAGLLGAAFTLGVYTIRTVRNVETIMPDYDAQKPASEPSTAT